MKEKSLEAIKAHPAWWLSALARRVPHTFFYGSELGIAPYPRDAQGYILWDEFRKPKFTGFKDAIRNGEIWEALKTYTRYLFTTPAYMIFQPLVFPIISIIGIWLARREWRVIVLIASAPLYYSAINIVFSVNWKTLLPGAFAYVLFSAIAIYYIALKLKILHEHQS